MQARRASMPLRTKSMLTNFVDMDNLTKKSWDYKSRASSCANDDGPMYMYVCAHGECEYAAHNCVMIHMHIWSRVVRIRALGAEAAPVKQWHTGICTVLSSGARVRTCVPIFGAEQNDIEIECTSHQHICAHPAVWISTWGYMELWDHRNFAVD
jgi:hypothetical protein